MKKAIIILSALFFSISIFAQFDGRRPLQSRVLTDSVFSKELNAYRAYTIFIPKSFEADKNKKYPILYLLHGMYDTNIGWFQRGTKDIMDQFVDSGEAIEMIIVSPNAGGNPMTGAWNGYFDMPGWPYEKFFFNEFIPFIEEKYRVTGDKKHRAIAGLSMGGGGSTSYAQKHPDMFCAVYAMSALMSLPGGQNDPPTQNPEDKMALLSKSVIENSCIAFVENADDATKEKLKTVSWYVDCGDDDFLLDRNTEFGQAMRKAGIPFEFRVRDGGHTSEYWRSALYTALPFVSRNFNK